MESIFFAGAWSALLLAGCQAVGMMAALGRNRIEAGAPLPHAVLVQVRGDSSSIMIRPGNFKAWLGFKFQFIRFRF